jgi:hypothetical protein
MAGRIYGQYSTLMAARALDCRHLCVGICDLRFIMMDVAHGCSRLYRLDYRL